MSGIRRAVRKFGSAIGAGVVLVGASHGAISGVTRQIGDPARIPAAVLYDYTGFNAEDGSFNQSQTIKSVSIILASVVAGKLVKWAAKHA